jgi:hypothetical protein
MRLGRLCRTVLGYCSQSARLPPGPAPANGPQQQGYSVPELVLVKTKADTSG